MTYQTISPYTGQTVKIFPNHSDQQVEQFLAVGYALYQSAWAQPENMGQRLDCLNRLAEIMAIRRDEIARIITIDMGKRLVESHGEVASCIDITRYYAEHAAEFLQPQAYPNPLGQAQVGYYPIGIVLAVEPWNFPFYQLVRVAVPAIAAGNSVLVKHASNVPQCAQLMEDLFQSAGLPEGGYRNLFVSFDQVKQIIADDRVQGVALTGSERAGSTVAGQAGAKLKKATMELGGNDVFVVLDDADIEQAVKTAVRGRLSNAGQVCTASKRYVVHKKVAQQFTNLVIEAFKNQVMGDPFDEATTLAPLSSASAKKHLQEQLDKAIAAGAQVLYGNQPAEGNFFTPTLITQIDRQNPAYFEEFFGPVAQLYVVDGDEEIIKLANDSHYGLSGVIFAGDIARAKQLAAKIETGMVFINHSSDTVPQLPFGGIKRSGFGRELSDLGIKEFVNQKLIVVGNQ